MPKTITISLAFLRQSVQQIIGRYDTLIKEYPYLKRLSYHLLILFVSFALIVLGNNSLIYRFGSIADWIQFVGVVGLFYGVLAGSAPYLHLETTAKPYQQLVRGQKKETNRRSSPIRDFAVGISLIISSFMVIAIFMATFSATSTLIDNFFFGVSILIFLLGIYFLIRTLRIGKVVKWLIGGIYNVVSLKWLRDLGEILTNSTVTISYDRRNRFERLQSNILINEADALNPTQTLYEALRQLKEEDYLIISIKNKPKSFIQYIKMAGHIRLEIADTKTGASEQKLKTAIKVLEDNKIYKSFYLGPLQLNPYTYYYQDTWRERDDVVGGNLVAIICKKDLLEAVNLGLLLLREVYKWEDDPQALVYQVNTFNDSWWNKL